MKIFDLLRRWDIRRIRSENERLLKENTELRSAISKKVLIALAEQQWLGVGAMIVSIRTDSGAIVAIEKIPYRPGGPIY